MILIHIGNDRLCLNDIDSYNFLKELDENMDLTPNNLVMDTTFFSKVWKADFLNRYSLCFPFS